MAGLSRDEKRSGWCCMRCGMLLARDRHLFRPDAAEALKECLREHDRDCLAQMPPGRVEPVEPTGSGVETLPDGRVADDRAIVDTRTVEWVAKAEHVQSPWMPVDYCLTFQYRGQSEAVTIEYRDDREARDAMFEACRAALREKSGRSPEEEA